jgi:Malectin-like domain
MNVMQTAVVGNQGRLTYTLNFPSFPGNAWAFGYFAEIEDLLPNETRIFKLEKPLQPPINDVAINVVEHAHGKYRTYEGGIWNVSLPDIASVWIRQTPDSSRGPILNALEILQYVLINFGSLDGNYGIFFLLYTGEFTITS